MPVVSIDAEYLKRMLLKAALAPVVAKKGLLPSVLDDLADRASRSNAFSLGEATKELIGDPEMFEDRLEAQNTAPHLFHREDAKQDAEGRLEKLSKLSPLERLKIANAAGGSRGG